MRFLILPFLLLFTHPTLAQPGCTDPQASNFNPGATQNDGSCLYPVTNYTPVFQTSLDNALKEISGLNYTDGQWWGHNDSGYDPTFYGLEVTTGMVLKTIAVNSAFNRDWEEICSDGTSLFIGDVGNNSNDRENLGVYQVPLTAIGNGGSQTVDAAFIPFAYPDQTDFSTQPDDSTVFDCEAMLYAQNKLHLFTKNWQEYHTTHYALDPLTQVVEKMETFDVHGLISGAGISPDGNLIVLVGYDLRGLPKVFCWLLWDWPQGTDLYFSGNKRRIELGSALAVGQVESIAFESDRSGYIANESTAFNGIVLVPQSVRKIDFSVWVPPVVATHQPNGFDEGLRIYPNPCTGTLFLKTQSSTCEGGSLEIFNVLGVSECRTQGIPAQLDLGWLRKGAYSLVVTRTDGVVMVQRLIRA